MTLTAADRETIEFNCAKFEKMTVKGLSDMLTEQKVSGRSKAKTRSEKIQLLMAQMWGYQALQTEETTPEPEISTTTECPYCTDPECTSTENYRCYICDPKRPEEFIYPAQEAESAATEEVIKHYSSGITELPGVSSWAFAKKRISNAIVTVDDPEDQHCLVAYAGDAMLLSRLLFTKLTEQHFDGVGAIARTRFDRELLMVFSVRLENQGIRIVKS